MVAAIFVNMYGSLPLHLEFMIVQLFQLFAIARCSTIATTDTTAMETIKGLSSLNGTLYTSREQTDQSREIVLEQQQLQSLIIWSGTINNIYFMIKQNLLY